MNIIYSPLKWVYAYALLYGKRYKFWDPTGPNFRPGKFRGLHSGNRFPKTISAINALF